MSKGIKWAAIAILGLLGALVIGAAAHAHLTGYVFKTVTTETIAPEDGYYQSFQFVTRPRKVDIAAIASDNDFIALTVDEDGHEMIQRTGRVDDDHVIHRMVGGREYRDILGPLNTGTYYVYLITTEPTATITLTIKILNE